MTAERMVTLEEFCAAPYYWGMTTRTLLGLAVMAMLLGGCREVPRKFQMIGFTAEEINVAAWPAALEWCVRTEGVYCPDINGGDNSIELVERTPGSDENFGLRVSTRDWTFDGDTVVYMEDRRESDTWLRDLRIGLLHEFGHCGSYRDDHLAVGNIMGPGVGATEHLTAADVAYITD